MKFIKVSKSYNSLSIQYFNKVNDCNLKKKFLKFGQILENQLKILKVLKKIFIKNWKNLTKI